MKRHITAMRGSVIVALAAAELGAAPVALGQRSSIKMKFSAAPSSPTTLGQPVTLGVRPVTPGTTYRYVATMSVTGSSMFAAGTSCATRSLAVRDSASVSYQVDPPNAGFLNATVMQYPQQPPGKLTLELRTNDRGPGHRYQWVVRFGPVPGAPPVPPVYWTGDTPMHFYSVPFAVQPGTYNISARVGIHTGDRCRILETSRGGLNGQEIQ